MRHPLLLLSAGAKMLCVAGVHGERFERGTRARKKPHFCGKRKNGPPRPPVVQIELNVSLIQQADLAEPMPHGIILLTIFQLLSISIRMALVGMAMREFLLIACAPTELKLNLLYFSGLGRSFFGKASVM